MLGSTSKGVWATAVWMAVAVVMVAMLGLWQSPASTASQEEQPDASCLGQVDNPTHEHSFSGIGIGVAQTFTVENTGRLTSVEVPVQDIYDEGDLLLEIGTVENLEIGVVDDTWVPTGTVLASASVPASQIPDSQDHVNMVRASFDPGVEVEAGQRYALVLRGINGGFFKWTGSSGNPCYGHSYVDSGDELFAIKRTNQDMYFSTFVTPPEIEIRSVAPGSGQTGETLTVEVEGSNLDAGAGVRLVHGQVWLWASSVSQTADGLSAEFSIPEDFPAGDYDVVVENPNGRQGSLADGFEVLAPEKPDPPEPEEPEEPEDPNRCTIKGDAKNNILKGTLGRDVICGFGGDDVLRGFGGNDLLKGGAGSDALRGGAGRDVLRGQGGDDSLVGGPGKDRMIGGAGRDATKQ